MRGQNGADFLEGGADGDHLTGGAASDTLIYNPVSDSTSLGFDTVDGFNFAGADVFELPTSIGATNAAIVGGTLDLATFDANLAAAVNGGTLGAGNAVLFLPNAGSEAGEVYLVADANSLGGYQAGADYVMHLVNSANLGAFNAADFI